MLKHNSCALCRRAEKANPTFLSQLCATFQFMLQSEREREAAAYPAAAQRVATVCFSVRILLEMTQTVEHMCEMLIDFKCRRQLQKQR